MKAIYASKLYKLSKRKAKIQAALADPVNLELVTQLKEYLDPEYQSDLQRDEDEKGENCSKSDSEKIIPSEGGAGLSGGGGSSFSDEGSGPDLGELTDQVETERADMLDDIEPSDVEESTKLPPNATSISGSTCIEENIDAIARDSDAIKGLLNSRADSTGAVRVAIEGTELWVYFEGDVNLNEVMEPAIAALNASGYTSLNFKKLSRPDNAITFEIGQTHEEVKPIKSE